MFFYLQLEFFECTPATQRSKKRSASERKTHKQIRGIVPGQGGCQKFVYVFFSGHSSWGKNNIPPKIPG